MSDNSVLRVSGETLERLKAVMGLADYKTAKGYATSVVDGRSRIVFFWADYESMVPFPTALTTDQLADIAMSWLKNEATYGQEPDHDGDNEKGWVCFSEACGHVRPFGWQAFIAVEPLWLMFGK